ncbi:nuclear transport factor 2 family protein [Nostoc sp. C117]|uniref:nuclear transport factor 2 family protein n=1 Tax=Nostoc sp. C117 TaxID=3349875 RepID=UPI00370D085F
MDTRPYELYISLDRIKSLWKCETNWQNELPLRAIFVALELSFLLIHETTQDPRSTVRSEERINRLFSGSRQQVELLKEVLNTTLPPESSLCNEQSTKTNLKILIASDEKIIQRLKTWSYTYTIFLQQFPFALGIEQYIDMLQLEEGMTNKILSREKPVFNYDKLINPDVIVQIFNLRVFNQEDRLFATVHQITECWLFVALDLLKKSELKAQISNWQDATDQISKVCSILNYLSEHILLLETMVLADYHPLRVNLRDASGAQSNQAFELVTLAKSLFFPIREYLKEHKCSLLDIYYTPSKHTPVYQYIEALSSLETRLSRFFFCHYKLATEIIGSESLGSLGFEVQALIKRFIDPLYLELDEVRYQYVVITNFEYGKCAGNLISSLEPKELSKTIDEIAEVPHYLISCQISQYIKAICEHDIDSWLALFEPDASIEDPYGSRAFRNHSGLKVFFRGFIKIFASDIELKDKRMLISPELGKAEFDWEINTTHKSIPIKFMGTEKIQFAQNGKIKNVQVFHDPSVISEQLLVHHGVISPKFSLEKISI